MKECTKCKKKKYNTSFYKDKQQKNNLACWCKKCRKESRSKWVEKNRTKYLKRLIKYSKTLKGRFVSIKCGAKRREILFSLSLEDFKKMWNKNCYYCGGKIKGIGIDRINNNKGYIIKNCVPCCSICNKMKLTMNIEIFINHCKKIINNFNKNTN